jgi:molybdopterin-guanine dinucleotide biosynthesis protein A
MIIMQCLGCDTVVVNPRVFNYMYEKCSPCVLKQKEQEEKAIDTFLHAEAERKLEQDA